MVPLDNLEEEVLMERWVLQENQGLLVNLGALDFPVFLQQREIQGELVLKVAPVFKDPEENLANLACLGRQGKWVHLEKMEVMERKEDPVFLVLQVLLDFQDQEANR